MTKPEDKANSSAHSAINPPSQKLMAGLNLIEEIHSTDLDLDGIYPVLAAKLKDFFSCTCVSLFFPDGTRTKADLRAFSFGESVSLPRGKYAYAISEHAELRDCVHNNHPAILKSVKLQSDDPRLNMSAQPLNGVLLPLSSHNGVIGMLEVLSTEPLQNADLELFEVMSRQVSLLLENRYTQKQIRQQSKTQHQLYEISNTIRQASDVESVLRLSAEKICSALNIPGATFRLYPQKKIPTEAAAASAAQELPK